MNHIFRGWTYHVILVKYLELNLLRNLNPFDYLFPLLFNLKSQLDIPTGL